MSYYQPPPQNYAHPYGYPNQYAAPQYPHPQYAAPQYPPPQYAAPPQYIPEEYAMAKPVRELRNGKINYKIVSENGQKIIRLFNVCNPRTVDINSATNTFHKGTLNGNTLDFTFNPDGKNHNIEIVDRNKVLYNLTITPKPVKCVALKEGGKNLLIRNLYNKKLIVKSNNKLTWNLSSSFNNKKLPVGDKVMQFDGHEKIHNLKLFTVGPDNKLIPVVNGAIRLVPKALAAARTRNVAPAPSRRNVAPNYAQYSYPPPQAYYNYPPPQAPHMMYAPPPQAPMNNQGPPPMANGYSKNLVAKGRSRAL